MSKITQDHRRPSIFLRESFRALMWPNGETVLSRPRTKKTPNNPILVSADMSADKKGLISLIAKGENAGVRLASYMGLSIRPIFDSEAGDLLKRVETDKAFRKRKGLTGITPYGKRMIRNAAHVLQTKAGKARCIFSTVTLPSLPIEQMHVIHENWGKLVEYYRLGVRRKLQDKKLSGELVTVTEVQEKRYKKTGLPVMHLHSIFVGVTAWGQYAMTTEEHDDIWVKAVNSVVIVDAEDFTKACNLQRVRKCASAYLGKYMSKGPKVVASIIRSGMGHWLPYHWWSCSRSLAAEVKGATRQPQDFADWLYDMSYASGDSVWRWHDEVLIELKSGKKLLTAIYGRIDPFIASQIEMSFDPWD